MLLRSPVWIMDHQKLVVKCGLAGVAIIRSDKDGKEEYAADFGFYFR